MLFAFRLARQCGFPHPRMMLERITSAEFAEAMAYASIDPCGEYRNELRHGQHLALIANINRDSEKRREPFTAYDFMNFTERPKEPELTPEQEQERIDREVFGLG